MRFEISRHAKEEMKRRALPQDLVDKILDNPQQIVDEYGNKKASVYNQFWNGEGLPCQGDC